MSRLQIALVLHAALLIGALFFVVPVLTGWNPQLGFLAVLAIYWLGFCLPVIRWHVRPLRTDQLFSERLRWRDWFVPLVLLLQVVVVIGVAVVAALEGLLYAAFPDAMRRALAGIVALPPERLRMAGLGVAMVGVVLATLIVRG